MTVATRKRIGILTGGGDVPPLNAVIASARETCLDNGAELIGFLNGWQGLLEGKYVNLSLHPLNPLTGGTILKSSRVRLETVTGGVDRVRENFRRIGLDGLIVIGGEDTLSNCLGLKDIDQILISKTIDNDVGIVGPSVDPVAGIPEIVNHFTLGYPTAARKISSIVSLREGLRTTAYSHERIIVVESMGMHAGWLALSSSLGHPDFIIIPEFPLDYEEFKERVADRFTGQGHVIIVTAEGARFKGSGYMSVDEGEMDDFGHPRFKGAAEVLAKRLKTDLKTRFDTRNVNAVNPSYLYRSGTPCDLDLRAAAMLGRQAVGTLLAGTGHAVFLTTVKTDNGFAVRPYPLTGVDSIEQLHRFVDETFYCPGELTVTWEGRNYLATVAEEIPLDEYGIPKSRD